MTSEAKIILWQFRPTMYPLPKTKGITRELIDGASKKVSKGSFMGEI